MTCTMRLGTVFTEGMEVENKENLETEEKPKMEVEQESKSEESGDLDASKESEKVSFKVVYKKSKIDVVFGLDQSGIVLSYFGFCSSVIITCLVQIVNSILFQLVL